MLMPSIFGDDFMDDFFRFPQDRRPAAPMAGMMRTDVKETENGYEVTVDLPGFKKEDVDAELKDGYLVINATTAGTNEDSGENGKYIRKERYSGSCQRSFYVGEHLHQDDITAKFEDGTLKLSIPKEEALPKVEEKKLISIQ